MKFKSEYEQKIASILTKKGAKIEYKPQIEESNYTPDFMAENLNGFSYIIEVKSRISNMKEIIQNLNNACEKLSNNNRNLKKLLIVFDKTTSFFKNKCEQEEIELWDIEKINTLEKQFSLEKTSTKTGKDNSVSTQKVEMDILENALDFIAKSFEEIQEPKLLKYALLHFTSGLELIFKAILLSEHWSLTLDNLDKVKENAYINRDFMSVNWENSIKRLKIFCEIDLTYAENDLQKLKNLRNRIEHYDCDFQTNSVIDLINNLTSLLVNLLTNNFNTNKLRKKGRDLFENIQSSLFTMQEHYEEAKKLMQKKIKDSNLIPIDVPCNMCKEKFVTKKEDNYICNLCKHKLTAEDIAISFIENELKINPYRIMKDGGIFPLHHCPECSENTFVYHCKENSEIIAHCYNCDEDYTNAKCCEICNEFFIPLNEDNLICKNCWENINSKD